MLKPSADRAHRRPPDGAGRAPVGRPLDPADITGTGRTVTTGAGLTAPVTVHLRDLPAGGVVVVAGLGTMTAADTLGALAARATRAIIRAVGTSPARITTSADAVWCPSWVASPRR